MATTVPVPLGKGFASFSMDFPCDARFLVAETQQDPYPPARGWRSGCMGAILTLQGCTGELSALDPAGPAARSIANIWNIMAWSSAGILVFMIVLTVYACMRQPRSDERPPAKAFLLGGGIVFPGVVLVALLIYGLRTGDAQSPVPGEDNAYRIEVRAHQWWWEVTYPDAPAGALTSRNEIHAPAGRPLYISVSTQDVIHGFWIPRLGGKIDAIPGRVNTIRLIADEPGVYHGVCAEFCGTGHAAMPIRLHAYDDASLEAALAGLRSEP